MEGIRAAEAVIKLERLLAGEPTERTHADIEAAVRGEYEAFMVPVGKGSENNDERDAGNG